MAIVSLKEMLIEASKEKYAVGQFNANSLEFIQAFLQAAQEERSPIIIGVTEAALQYLGGFSVVSSAIRSLVKEYEIHVPVAIHLDHCTSVEQCVHAMKAGFTSVMIDGSHLPLEKNIRLTQEVVEAAEKFGVSVEAELGRISGQEDDTIVDISEACYVIPEECQRFTAETGVNCLAPSLGTVHGLVKGEPNLRFDILEKVKELTSVPLALHGGTGIPGDHLKRAVSMGISKVNVNTENQILFTQTVREILISNQDLYDLRKYLGAAREAIKHSARQKMCELGSDGKA